MLEGPSYVISRELASSCEQESKWVYNSSHHVMEVAKNNNKNKHLLEDGDEGDEEAGLPKKSRQQSDYYSSSWELIYQLGRDMSINCLLHCSRSEYRSIGSLNRGFRSIIRGGELYKLRKQMGIIEHWVYLSCSLLEWDAYDPNSNRWMRLPSIVASSNNECFMSSDKESLAVGTELLVFGKEITMSQVIHRYSILENKWSFGKNMKTPRFLFGSASLGEIAIVAGGCDPGGKVLNSAELYNSEKGTWVSLPRMNKARKMCSAIFMEGKFYVIGGMGPGNTSLSCGEEYNLKSGKWREIPNMYTTTTTNNNNAAAGGVVEAPPLVAVVKDKLYAADCTQREVKRYEKGRESWEVVGRLPERVVSTNGWGLAFKACGDRLMVLGGPRALGGRFIEIYSWTPNQNQNQAEELQWSVLSSRQLGNFVYNCAVMGC